MRYGIGETGTGLVKERKGRQGLMRSGGDRSGGERKGRHGYARLGGKRSGEIRQGKAGEDG